MNPVDVERPPAVRLEISEPEKVHAQPARLMADERRRGLSDHRSDSSPAALRTEA